MWFCDSASLFSSMNRNKSYIQAIVNVLLNISKIKVNWKKKLELSNQFASASEHVTNIKRCGSAERWITAAFTTEQQQEWSKISSQLGVFCSFLPLLCNQSCAGLHLSHFCIHHCTGRCTGNFNKVEEKRSLVGLFSDIWVRFSPLNLRVGTHLI